MKVSLVEDVGNAPGRIYAVFRNREDAEKFAYQLPEAVSVVERTLWEGQPSNFGFNE